ncbi:IS110 family transposase [Endozoicomonas sp. SM1973]|uniref:IS110 family transposase n=1 Tax=Spartinivicinus marinus TaxID=2994442 RepID=A0A853HYI8_9GAMM|nr:IS110 family transposase [Spartinivicinus marinus]MCX4024710.1 IS110 family transposase [Spartinivicinus marinus]NYZ66263.1 IS110 family transposase [Spartinivicinus marinus]
MNNSVISIDLAKNSFQICALNSHHKVVFNKKVTRKKLVSELQQLSPAPVIMEACYSANPWGRKLQELGFDVKLIPPYQVKPFLVGNKNDHNDAVAIAEASLRPKARFVPVKTLEQQDVQSLQRIRERLIKSRTALVNQLRGLLSEYGIVVEKLPYKLKAKVPLILEDSSNPLTVKARQFIQSLYQEWDYLDKRINDIEEMTDNSVKDNEDYQRLINIPGIGPVTATALIASICDPHHFKNGRHMAAWIGLTPSQYASGDSNKLGGITKRGNRTLRRLLIHGARALMNWSHKKNDKFSRWINALCQRMHVCKAIVAIANKLARIAWAVLAKKESYNPAVA